MKIILFTFLAMTLMNQPDFSYKVSLVSQIYTPNVADILDPSFPKLA